MRRAGGHGMSEHQMLEDENDKMVDHLAGKVQALKSLTIDIGHEVRSQNSMLGDMDNDFDETGGFLSGTMNRLTALTNKGHHRVMCYLFLFCLFVFFLAWYLVKSRTR